MTALDLIVDVGNTRAHLALFRGADVVARTAVAHGDPAAIDAAVAGFFAGHPAPARAAAVEVNPDGLTRVLERIRAAVPTPVRVLGRDLACPILLDVDRPEEVGPDRMANAVWGARTFPGQAVCVVDLGTAITFDVVSPAGAFVGGLIAPGLRLGARALADGTARLPAIDLDIPPPVIGRTTETCIAAGLIWGAVGLIESLTPRLARSLGQTPRVVLTGGDAERVAPRCADAVDVVPDLTLQGVRLALVEAGG